MIVVVIVHVADCTAGLSVLNYSVTVPVATESEHLDHQRA